MIEEEEEAIMEANNVTDDTFSPAFSPLRQNTNTIFESENLESLNKLVNAVAIFENTTINIVVYELNVATPSDAQVEFAITSDGITHASNGITRQNLLSSQMIRIRHKDIYVVPPPTNP